MAHLIAKANSDRALLGCVFAVMLACTKAPVADDDDALSGSGGDCSQPEVAPLLETDVVPILSANCVFASHCHGSMNYNPTKLTGCLGGLALEDVALGSADCPELTLHERLTQVGPGQCQQPTALVAPCNPEASYLLTKISGGPYCDGERMPLLADPLSDVDLRTIRDWIASGAGSNDVAAATCDNTCSE